MKERVFRKIDSTLLNRDAIEKAQRDYSALTYHQHVIRRISAPKIQGEKRFKRY